MDLIPLFVAVAAFLSLGLVYLMIWYEYSPLAVGIDPRLVAVLAGFLSFILMVGWFVLAPSVWAPLFALLALGGMAWGVVLRWFTYRRIPIRVQNGEAILSGTLYTPLGDGLFPAVVFLPEPGNATRVDFQEMAKLLCRHKIAALVYDKRGCGESTGDGTKHTFDTLADDAAEMIWAATGCMMIDPQRVGLWAYDAGGWIAPLVAERVPGLACMVLVSITHLSPADQALFQMRQALVSAGFSQSAINQALGFQRRIFAYHRSGGEATQTFQAEIDNARWQPWFSVLQYFDHLEKPGAYVWWRSVMDYHPEPRWQWVSCPVLLVSGGQDPKMPVAETHYTLRKALKKRGNLDFKTCVLKKMGHQPLDWWLVDKLLPPRYPPGFRRCALNWLSRHLHI